MPNQIRDITTIDKDNFPYIFEQNVTVKLQSNTGLVRLNVYRPKGAGKVPVIMTYGPYGKDTPYSESVVAPACPPSEVSDQAAVFYIIRGKASIPSTSPSTLRLKSPTLSSGRRKATLWSPQIKLVSDNHLASIIPCQSPPLKYSTR